MKVFEFGASGDEKVGMDNGGKGGKDYTKSGLSLQLKIK